MLALPSLNRSTSFISFSFSSFLHPQISSGHHELRIWWHWKVSIHTFTYLISQHMGPINNKPNLQKKSYISFIHSLFQTYPWPTLSPVSQRSVTRPSQLEREARRLGRSLVRTGDEDDDDDDDDYDDDLMDLETSNIVLTPLLRSVYLTDWMTFGCSKTDLLSTVCVCVCLIVCLCSRCRPLSRNVVAGTPKVQSFQVSSFIHPFLITYPDPLHRLWNILKKSKTTILKITVYKMVQCNVRGVAHCAEPTVQRIINHMCSFSQLYRA